MGRGDALNPLDIIIEALQDEADDRGLTGTPEEDRLEEVLNSVAARIARKRVLFGEESACTP